MANGLDPERWINLERVSVLVLEQSEHGQKIAMQILRGFGIRELHGALGMEDARSIVDRVKLDLVVADPSARNGEGLEFLRWLRRAEGHPNRFVPIILVSGHTSNSSVALSRDAGASFFVAKPYTPKVMLERIMFVARDERPYVEVGAYVGPDRRFKSDAAPEGAGERRTEIQVPDAAAPASELETEQT